MDRTSGANYITLPGTSHRGFVTQNLAAGVFGTQVEDVFLNGTQEEIVGVIEASGQAAAATDWTQLLKAVQIIGRRSQTFGTSQTWVVPAGVTSVMVLAVGAGGAGASVTAIASGSGLVAAAPGGNAGCWGIGTYAVTPGQTIAVTVGGPTASGSLNVGATSSFGSFLSAPGGHGLGTIGGSPTPINLGGPGGSNVPSGAVVYGVETQAQPAVAASSTNGNSSPGGASLFGGGGNAVTNTIGNNGRGYGAGGSGACAYAGFGPFAGGAGAAGVVIVWW